MAEQRRQARRGFLKPLVIFDGDIQGYVEDLTRDGCGLVVLGTLAVGQSLALKIRFHRRLNMPEIDLEGQVRWVASLPDRMTRAGIRFDRVDPASATAIIRYMLLASRVAGAPVRNDNAKRHHGEAGDDNVRQQQ